MGVVIWVDYYGCYYMGSLFGPGRSTYIVGCYEFFGQREVRVIICCMGNLL